MPQLTNHDEIQLTNDLLVGLFCAFMAGLVVGRIFAWFKTLNTKDRANEGLEG